MDSIFYQKYRTGDLMAHATNDLSKNVAGAGILTFADSVITEEQRLSQWFYLSIGA